MSDTLGTIYGDAREAMACARARAEGVAAGLRMAAKECERRASSGGPGHWESVVRELHSPATAADVRTIAAWCEAAAKDAEAKR